VELSGSGWRHMAISYECDDDTSSSITYRQCTDSLLLRNIMLHAVRLSASRHNVELE
jgi:hypothetical protein